MSVVRRPSIRPSVRPSGCRLELENQWRPQKRKKREGRSAAWIGWGGRAAGEKYRVAPQREGERARAVGCDWTVGDQKNTFLAPKEREEKKKKKRRRRRRFFSRFSVEELEGSLSLPALTLILENRTFISIYSAFYGKYFEYLGTCLCMCSLSLDRQRETEE